MERRTLLAVFLAFVVLYVYQTYVAPPSPPAARQTAEAPASTAAAAPAPETAAPTPVEPMPETTTGVTAEAETVLENETVRAVFSNRGGRLTSWVLKGYTDRAGAPVDLVARDLPAGQPQPLTLETDDAATTRALNLALYSSQIDREANRVVFSMTDASGLTARKTFQLEPANFLLSADLSVERSGTRVPAGFVWGPGPGDLGPTTGGGFFSSDVSRAPEALVHAGTEVERLAYSDVTETATAREGAFRFVGIDDHYFIVAAVGAGQGKVTFTGVSHAVAGTEGRQRQLLAMQLRTQDPATPVKFYVGPKAFDVMKAVDAEFVRAINFGFWAWLAVPFLDVLKWIYGYSGNWGWAIIILTLLMNIVIFPLRHKTAVSMRKMQEIQPQMKAIQDRYAGLKATDPARQKMNSEIMALYKEKGANPVSGCIPTLLTFPLLFAFYALLSEAIELRNAPFAFWIRDLSVHDPYFVTPALMGAAMLWQQWLTPATGDPVQRRMMMFMPVLFVGMFLTLPSGLAIYYFVNTIWGIGQQYFTNWLLGPLPVQAPRPAAERRVKSAGSGRTEGVERKS
ncbi:MAG: membrane protein insertase YidC [Vicinamibacterales bacterium]